METAQPSSSSHAGPPAGGRWASLVRALESQRGDRVAWIVLATAMAGFAGLSLWLLRGTTFVADELSWFGVSRGLDLEAFITPHNGHLIALTRIIYAAGLELFGTEYLPYRLVVIAGGITASVLLYLFVRRRVGPVVALAPAIVVLFLGSGSDAVLSPVGNSNVLAIAAGLGALIALDRRDLRGDVAACALLVVAAAAFTVGLAFVVGALVWVMLGADRWRRAWVFAVPALLYAAWWVWALQFDQGRIALENVLLVPSFAADAFAAAAGSLVGLNYVPADIPGTEAAFGDDLGWGRAIAVLAVVALIVRVLRGPMPPAFWALLAIPLALWTAGGLGYSVLTLPNASRIIYPSAVAVVVVAAEAVRGVRLSPPALLVLLAAVAFSLATNVAHLRDAAEHIREGSANNRVRLATIEIARDSVAPDFTYGLFAPVRAGPYLEAVERHGSFAFSPPEIELQPEERRRTADAGLAQILRPTIVPLRLPPPGPGCETAAAEEGADSITFELPVGGALLRSPARAAVRLRRFADEFAVDAGELREAPWSGALRIPPDAASQPWTAQVGTWEPVTICPIADAPPG